MLSDYWMEKLCKLLSHKANVTAPDTYVALFTTIPTRAAVGAVEPSTGGYARIIINPNSGSSPKWTAPASQPTKEWRFANDSAVEWTAGADWGQIVGWGIYDALTAGNLVEFDFFTGEFMAAAVLGSTDTLTSYAHGLVNDDRVCVRVIPGTALPGGSETVLYYVVNKTTDTLQLSLTSGGAAVAFSDGEMLISKVTPRTVSTGEIARLGANGLQLFHA